MRQCEICGEFMSLYLLNSQQRLYLPEDAEQFFLRFGAEHGDARVAEVGDAFEQRAGGQVAAHVQDAPAFVEQAHAVYDLPAQHVELPGRGEVLQRFAGFQIMFYFAEYPRAAEAGAAYHDGVHAVAFEALPGALGGGDVAVADDGDVHAGVAFHFTYQRPVGLAGVHLCAGAPVDGEGPDAAVLQLFGKVDNDFMFGIPA